MSTETLESTNEAADIEPTEVIDTPEPEAAPNDAAFESGFAHAMGEEPKPEPTPEPPKMFGYTEEQFKDLFAKAQEVDKLKEREAKIFGTLGSLKQAIESRREQPAATAKITKDSLKRLSAEFPEMAEMLYQDLSEISMPQSGGFDPSVVERMVEARVDRAEKASETKLLTMMHSDWRTVVQTPEFGGWKETLSPEDKEVLDNGWDAISIGERISAFKEWKSKAAQTKVSNQRRLEAAVTPRTTARAAPVVTEDDAFVQGFNSARGK